MASSHDRQSGNFCRQSPRKFWPQNFGARPFAPQNLRPKFSAAPAEISRRLSCERALLAFYILFIIFIF